MIQLPKPCSKEWSQLHGNNSQRFCDACNKNVVNIDQLEKLEIEELILKTKSCVKISKSKLHALNQNYSSFSKFTLFSSFLISSFLFAQTDSIQIKGKIIDVNHLPVMDSRIRLENTPLIFYSDEFGNFSGKIPINLVEYNFIVADEENNEKVFHFKKEQLVDELNINIGNAEDVIIGEVIMHKPTFKQRVINTITWPYRKIRSTFFVN